MESSKVGYATWAIVLEKALIVAPHSPLFLMVSQLLRMPGFASIAWVVRMLQHLRTRSSTVELLLMGVLCV